MSHFTRVTTKFTSQASLLAALQRLDLEPETRDKKVSIRGYRGRPGPGAEIVINHEQFNSRYKEDLGFALQTDGSYEAIYAGADLRTGALGRDFLQRLSEEYAIAEIERDGTYEIVERLGKGKFSVRPKALIYESAGSATEDSAGSWANYEV